MAGKDYHPRPALDLAAPLMSDAVDPDAAFIADSHAAKRLARLPTHGDACMDAGLEQCRSDGRACAHRQRLAICLNGQMFAHPICLSVIEAINGVDRIAGLSSSAFFRTA